MSWKHTEISGQLICLSVRSWEHTAKKYERESLLNLLSSSPDDPVGQGTELNDLWKDRCWRLAVQKFRTSKYRCIILKALEKSVSELPPSPPPPLLNMNIYFLRRIKQNRQYSYFSCRQIVMGQWNLSLNCSVCREPHTRHNHMSMRWCIYAGGNIVWHLCILLPRPTSPFVFVCLFVLMKLYIFKRLRAARNSRYYYYYHCYYHHHPSPLTVLGGGGGREYIGMGRVRYRSRRGCCHSRDSFSLFLGTYLEGGGGTGLPQIPPRSALVRASPLL